MGQVKAEQEYSCDNDCERSGCPKHKMTLVFNSIANIYTYDDGQGQKCSFDYSSMEAFIKMVRHFSETRADTVKL